MKKKKGPRYEPCEIGMNKLYKRIMLYLTILVILFPPWYYAKAYYDPTGGHVVDFLDPFIFGYGFTAIPIMMPRIFKREVFYADLLKISFRFNSTLFWVTMIGFSYETFQTYLGTGDKWDYLAEALGYFAARQLAYKPLFNLALKAIKPIERKKATLAPTG